jgi:hypothetical protein
MWNAIFEFCVWGSVLVFELADVTVMVTSDRYCAMLENFLRPKLDGVENVWFQHDGVTATHLVVR